MSRYVYVFEYNDGSTPTSTFSFTTMSSRIYHEIRSRCREISRNKLHGTCYIYRAEVDLTEYEIARAFCSGLVKSGERWEAGDIELVYIGTYSHSRNIDITEFYADWTLGRTADTRHSMYVITPR